jgi:hypothetical protein
MGPIRSVLLCAAAAAGVPASAALPPHYQRLAELRAVLAHPQVARMGQSVDRIEYVKSDLYRVTAGRCRMDVTIVGLPTPPGMAGPRRFEARPGRKVCGR